MLRWLYLLSPIALMGCSDISSTTVFSADFSEIEDTRFLTFLPPGAPRFDRIQVADRFGGDADEVAITGGKMRFSSRANPSDQLTFMPSGSSVSHRSLIYSWNATFDQVGLGENFVTATFAVPRARRAPLTVLRLSLQSGRLGENRVVRIFGPNNEQVGIVGFRRAHNILVSINVEDGTFLVNSDRTTGPFDLVAAVPPSALPQVSFTQSGTATSPVEYAFGSFLAVAFRRDPS